jgi:hypothetical protein
MKPDKVVCALFLLISPIIALAQAWGDNEIPTESSYQQHIQIVNAQLDAVAQGVTIPQTCQIAKNDTKNDKKDEWDIDITPEVSYIKYHEHGLMRESGTMAGINTRFTYHPKEGNVLNNEITDVYRFEGKFSFGKVDYQGGIQNSDLTTTPESHKGINDYMVEIRSLMGKDFFFNNRSTVLTPFFGAGYRSLFDSLFENKPYGYNRHIQYLYVPTGMEVTNDLSHGWSIQTDAEYDIFFRGYVTSYLGEIGYGDLHNTQSSGFGMRGSIKLIKKSDHFNFTLEPFVRYWSIHASNIKASAPFTFNGQQYVFIGEEPPNTSLEVGGRVGIDF